MPTRAFGTPRRLLAQEVTTADRGEPHAERAISSLIGSKFLFIAGTM